MKHRVRALCLLGLPGLVAGCIEAGMPGPDEGATLFADNCTQCHGAGGTGGIAPDLTSLAARNGGSFPRAAALSQIDGYGRGGVAADIMPEFGSLLEGPLVPVEVDGVMTPTPRPLAALLAYLESIQSP